MVPVVLCVSATLPTVTVWSPSTKKESLVATI
ncbi:unnamed protein product [Timema podura]|uniref:Uncharacterized protein n=1 Tax=Timema podura TaxID=61482 RepID=A0ABN7PLZ9_TIMPD|nr:unnamed protein product [Timema podura]CAG2068089.1 unnamed protein product [Timema podura]